MNISKQLARNIVKNLKDVLKQEINFIDTTYHRYNWTDRWKGSEKVC